MKNILLTFLLIFGLIQIGFSQSGELQKKKISQQVIVSKYDITLDKNTKEKAKPLIQMEIGKMPTIKAKIANSNGYYDNYIHSPKNNKNYASLLKAYELNSDVAEMYFEVAKYYESIDNKKEKKKICKKLKNSLLTKELKEYAYNTLMSVEKNGILITYGEDDTYPIWVLQTLENTRTDVKVLNYDLLMNDVYRAKKAKEFGLNLNTEYKSNIKILTDIAIKNPTKNIYYSLTVSHTVLGILKKNLYSTGLALKYSTSKINNSEIIKTNWENKFQKKYVIQPKNASNLKKMNANYILPLVQLAKYYKKNKQEKELKILKENLLKIGKNAKKEVLVKKIIAKI